MIVFDIDGTLTEKRTDINHCLKSFSREDILKFMDPVLVSKLKPRQDIINQLNSHYKDGEFVAIVTGRWHYLEYVTNAWLNLHEIKYHAIAFREAKYYNRTAVECKLEAINLLINSSLGFLTKPRKWYDDDDEMLMKVKELGFEGVLV